VLPDVDEQTFDGIDLLDPTKIVPEEAAPVQPIGLMVLTGTPTNFFAEVEQVAFHVGHLVPGIDVTDDPLVQARLFSYVDTQITRLGGPNFNQIPVNRPHTETNDMLRDGFHQHAVHSGLAPYRPNSLDGGCPFHAGADTEGAFEHLATRVAEGSKVRAQPASFDDHFSQARLFWLSMTPVEQEHIIGAYSFELAKCTEDAVRQRQLECLAQIDARLCAEVAAGLGMPVPQDAPAPPAVEPSPALSQVGRSWPVDGRTVAVVVGDPGDAAGVAEVCETLVGRGVTPLVVAAQGGMIGDWKVARTFAAARSVEFDAVVLAGAPAAAADAQVPRDAKAGAPGAGAVDPRVSLLVGEAFRHAKPIGAWGSATTVLEDAGWADAAGVVSGSSGTEVLEAVLGHLARHRVWERFPA
jgi:catalase